MFKHIKKKKEKERTLKIIEIRTGKKEGQNEKKKHPTFIYATYAYTFTQGCKKKKIS